jgi:hypothetical protein
MTDEDETPDEFAARLRQQWLAGRAIQGFERMHSAFLKYVGDEAPRRAQELMERLDEAPLVPGVSPAKQASAQLMMAWSQALAEGVLVVVALEVAHQEAKGPPP